MRELPAGTVTFLFTDVEGSTRLLQTLGHDYAKVLAEHHRVLRETFAARKGIEVDTQGDAFFYAFESTAAAAAAAVEAQRALAEGPIRVRIGIHTGEPLLTDEGYIGIDVHRAARIAAAGHGGQVLISRTTRALLEPSTDLRPRDLGEHRLKDLSAPERIFQLGEGDFPPLKSLNATNLPVAANPLVGRERELEELQALLRDSARLVTIVGTGGTGKTRLGLQVAAELVDYFPGGVFFIPLAGVQEPKLVASTVTSTVGVRELEDLRDRQALLLVDNFEHVIEAAPTLATLLAAGSRAKVLATSRAPLRIEGEREYPLEPLSDDDAVSLLTERARAVRPDFEPDEATREICRRLDGLPLALELAAARLRSLGSAALLERLHRRLPLLTGGRRDAPERQRTLRATIEWSYDLLGAELQELFGRLAVFAGTFSVEAAERVTDAGFDELDALVEASLLKPVGQDRFLMLETIRELALERLDADDAAEAIRLRHAEFFTELARSANLNIEASGPMRHGIVIPEHDNIRAALGWTIQTRNGELGLRLAAALENFWVTTDPEEGRRWIEALLPIGPPAPSPLHALALRCLGNCAAVVGSELAEPLYERSLAEFRLLGDDLRAADLLSRIGAQTARRGDHARARELIEQSLESHRRSGFRKGEATPLGLLGNLERRAGRLECAVELYDRALVVARDTGFTWWEQNMLLLSAQTLFELERPREAGRCAAEAADAARRTGDRAAMIEALAFLARAAAEQGRKELAGRLWGAVEAEVERAPVSGWEEERAAVEPSILAHAGPEFEAGRSAGHRLSLQDAATLASELLSQ